MTDNSDHFINEYEKALDGLSLEEVKKICAISLNKFKEEERLILPYTVICDDCHSVQMGCAYDGTNYDLCEKCNQRGLCEKCCGYDEFICDNCSDHKCGLCEHGEFYEHDECVKIIKPLLDLPNDIQSLVFAYVYE